MADIGQTLREARMRARIDMGEVEAQTKIRARYLRAIENEEWDLLPGPVYIKSFLRTYADYLGLDSRLLVDEFKRQYELPNEHELRPSPSLRQGRERDRGPRPVRGPLLPPWLIVGVVLVAVVAALYFIGSGSGGNGGRPNPASSHATNRKTHHHATTTAVRHTRHRSRVAKLKLVATSSVYICVENRGGKVMLPGGTYSPGQSIPTLKAGQLFVTLGNNAVRMTADGKRYAVPASASAIGLRVTSKGVSNLPAGRGPTCASG